MRVKQAIDNFLNNDVFICIIAFLSFIGWEFKFAVPVLLVYVIIAIYIFAGTKNPKTFIPIMFSTCFIIRDEIFSEGIPWWIVVFAILLILTIVFFIIKNKVKFKKWRLTLGLGVIGVAALVSLKNVDIELPPMMWILSFCGFVYLLIYLFVRNMSQEDILVYTFKCILAAAMVVSVEVYSSVAEQYLKSLSEPVSSFWTNPSLGWGVRNDAAIYMNMGVGAAMYLIAVSKRKVIPFACLSLLLTALLVTESRGGILTCALTIIPYFVLTFYFSKDKKQLIICFSFFLALFAILGICCFDGIMSSINRLLTVGLDDNGRSELYSKAIDEFIEHPIFGGSLFTAIDWRGRLVVFHSTIFQTIGCFGIVGCIGLLIHLVQVTILLIRSRGREAIFVALILITSHIHGLLDNTFYMIIYMLIYLTLLAAFESHAEYGMEKEKPIENITLEQPIVE